MISSAVYRFRAMPPPFVGWNPNSRLDLVYRGQVSTGNDQVFRSAPEDAQKLLNELDSKNVKQFMTDTRLDGTMLTLRYVADCLKEPMHVTSTSATKGASDAH